ncbi:uncharacterized protein LOC134240145 [Saccostrea cucullata]|uniref:uncharacterized protein LOC134240145 n=1 Tax=Saccostrea cuccullata TaxID=36930 RepID=UPI002ED282E6
MIPLIVLLLFASLSSIESLDHSCKDIHAFNQKSRNDTYWIQNRNNQFYKVFCEFHDTFGYTYISRNTTVEINIDDLLSTKKHVKIRKVQDDGSQIETVLRNIEQYKNLSLGIFYNNHTGYAQPRIYSKILAPYLYVGFLPKEIANNNNTQGYRAGNEDKTFTNCDKNPNSYFVLYFNPNQELIETSKYNDFLQFWIISGSKAVHNMPSEFYFDYEIHFGGCGGFIFRHQKENKDGISIGLKFDFLTSCLSSPCYNEGSCRAISDTDFTCDCKYGYTGELCDILTQDPMCNLGIVHRHNASLSSVYVYYLPDEVTVTSKLLAEKALDSKYYRHKWDCAGSLDKQPDRDAWWQVTFSSPSMIYKMNFVFREKR